MDRFAALALLAAACGGEVGDAGLDAASIDGNPAIDADGDAPPAIDAAVDAPPPAPFSGAFTLLETELMMPGVAASFGQGLQLRVAFTENAMLPPPLMQEGAGPDGCKVWEYTAAQAAYAASGIDEGPIRPTFSGGTSPGTPPALPVCAFAPGAGYVCSDFVTGSTGGVIGAAAGGNATLTDNDITYTAASSLGRHLRISGAAMAANDGLFPIVGFTPPSTLTYVNAARVAEVLPGGATHINVAGAGVIPGASDPGFLADDAALSFNHVAGGANHVPAFTLMTTGPEHLGDDFTLDQASLALLTHLPRTGVELMFTCATNCAPENAPLSVIEIVTTDAPLAGLPPLAMPPPVTKQIRIRCARSGGVVIVPAAYSAKLGAAGVTRMQATFTRAAPLMWPEPPVHGLVGHAIVAVTTP